MVKQQTAIAPTESHNALALAGVAANQAAARHVFTDYRNRKAVNTLRRQRADLDLFALFLAESGTPPAGDLQTDPESWRGMTWGLVSAFVQWQLKQGYAIASVNVRLSTVKRYATLAFQTGAVNTHDHALIKTVKGYTHKEGRYVDKKRAGAGLATRVQRQHGQRYGLKKQEPILIDYQTAQRLKSYQPDTPQGRRDALLMCLALDHGLRCGELALLKVGHFNLTEGTFIFYRPKVNKEQTHEMTRDTRRAFEAYVNFGDCPLAADAPLLRSSNKAGKLTAGRMSERAITKRIQHLGADMGIAGFSAHDCRHFWATRAARNGTDPFALQEAGGWNSLAMPRRYVEDAKIANAGVNLE